MIDNPNAGRGPWCAICGVEMSRPNHRFQACVNYDGGFETYRYHGGALKSGFSPICGERCLAKAVSEWASPPRPTPLDADVAGPGSDHPVLRSHQPLPAAGAVRIPPAPSRAVALQKGSTAVAAGGVPLAGGRPRAASSDAGAKPRLVEPRPGFWSRTLRVLLPGVFAPGYSR